MKKIFMVIAGIAAMLSACDNVDSNDRLIYVPPAAVGRCVLIEDFTGQKCLNCPRAVEVIEQLQKQYGADTVIAVAIHAGPLSVGKKAGATGLRTATGDLYYKHWKIDSQPSGLVNRRGKPSNDTRWPSLVYQEIQQKAAVSIKLAVEYDTQTRTSHIKATVNTLGKSLSGRLQLWVLEDNIKAAQRMPDGNYNNSYVHNHVFRAAVNGVWGDDIRIDKDAYVQKEYMCKLEEGWDAACVSIVAFVYTDDEGVLQATRKAVVK